MRQFLEEADSGLRDFSCPRPLVRLRWPTDRAKQYPFVPTPLGFVVRKPGL